MESFASLTRPPRRIVLCFDGTGNSFQGNVSDTNIVKLFQMLDRRDANQFHYYQPGIGTYNEKESAKPHGHLGRIASHISSAVDQAVGTSFVDHVTAGYRFLMRYYMPGDSIYIFGFSRGAYTARFLAEMLHTIGLLSQGNEEMIFFAWETFSKFQQTRGDKSKSEAILEQEQFMVNFKQTFCRPPINVHFLGLFDCVNSVSQFEIPLSQKSFTYIPRPPATHIRHAVSIHERRLKFKPALFIMDGKKLQNDTVEMWFAGDHGDIGGGWSLRQNQHRLLSDAPLAWMVHELQNLPQGKHKLSFQTTSIRRDHVYETKPMQHLGRTLDAAREDKRTLEPHDMLWFFRGASMFAVVLWWILELLPIFTRLELEHGRWVPRHWPPNLGAPRDIPHGALIHQSVYDLRDAGILSQEQMPKPGGDNPHVSAFRAMFSWRTTPNVRTHGSHKPATSYDVMGAQPSVYRRLLEFLGVAQEDTQNVSSVLTTALANGRARL